LTAPPGLSQSSTPFVASWRQDIPHTPLVAWPHWSRPRRAVPATARRDRSSSHPPVCGWGSNDPTLSKGSAESHIKLSKGGSRHPNCALVRQLLPLPGCQRTFPWLGSRGARGPCEPPRRDCLSTKAASRWPGVGARVFQVQRLAPSRAKPSIFRKPLLLIDLQPHSLYERQCQSLTCSFCFSPSPVQQMALLSRPHQDRYIRVKTGSVFSCRSAVGGVVAAVLAFSRSHAVGIFTLQMRPTVDKRCDQFFPWAGQYPPTARPQLIALAQVSSRP
jgi:hypothetical protein